MTVYILEIGDEAGVEVTLVGPFDSRARAERWLKKKKWKKEKHPLTLASHQEIAKSCFPSDKIWRYIWKKKECAAYIWLIHSPD